MKTQKEIVKDVRWHYDYEVKLLKEARKKYYLETRRGYQDIWFEDYRKAKYCIMSLAMILGIYEDVKDKFDIVITR